jgi:hypothetical protein
LGDEIETFNYTTSVKVIFSSGIRRIFEDENVDDSYKDSLLMRIQLLKIKLIGVMNEIRFIYGK